MKRAPHIFLSAALIWLSSAFPALAEPVTITTGSVIVAGFGVVSPPSTLTGTGGFRLTGNVAAGPASGRVDAIFLCQSGFDCQPGTALSLGAFLGAGDSIVNAVVRYRGVEYRSFGLNDPFSLFLELTGSVVLPAFGDFSARTIAAPFLLSGLFSDAQRGLAPSLNGRGTATVFISPWPEVKGMRAWRVDQLRYDVQDLDPVPEPSTFLLIGTGLAALVRARKRLHN